MKTAAENDILVKYYELSLAEWEKAISGMLNDNNIYAPVKTWGNIDYELLKPEKIESIVYNTPKPSSPLKLFLLPVKENVVLESDVEKPLIVIGAPACDLLALDLLDDFYLNKDYVDPYYKLRREKMLIIGFDCHSMLEHCHCTSYGLNPYPEKNHDIVLSVLDGKVLLGVNSSKGDAFIEKLSSEVKLDSLDGNLPEALLKKRQVLKSEIDDNNKLLPNYQETTTIVRNAEDDVWKEYAAKCVACGACATICPTCTCFLLIDRPGFEKVKQMDACQYPGFQRVAGDEDQLKEHHVRFRNRYMCKYVYRPEKYDSIACTGCGRCIEACIGEINKNEFFINITK